MAGEDKTPMIDWRRLLKVASVVIPIISTVSAGSYAIVEGIAVVVRSADEVHAHLDKVDLHLDRLDTSIKDGNSAASLRWQTLDTLQQTVAGQGAQINGAADSSKRAEDAANATSRQLTNLMTQLLSNKRFADEYRAR